MTLDSNTRNFISTGLNQYVSANRRIRYCFEVKDGSRLIQSAQTSLFESLSKFAQDVPIVAIATKKDIFLSMKVGQKVLQQPHAQSVSLETLKVDAERELEDELRAVERDLNAIGRLDGIVSVSTGEFETCRNLNEILTVYDFRRQYFIREAHFGNTRFSE
jgi:hypothetical protein